jgi:hypothetical protein
MNSVENALNWEDHLVEGGDNMRKEKHYFTGEMNSHANEHNQHYQDWMDAKTQREGDLASLANMKN